MRRGLLSIVALGAAALAVAVSTSAAAPTATQASSSGGLGKQAVTNYVKYVDGKAGKANSSLAPVAVGFVNQQGGQIVIGADATLGAQLAVNYDSSAASAAIPSC